MAFDWGSLIGAGVGLLGSSMQNDAAESASTANADAARIAAEAAAFRPVGLTTRFGKAGYNYDASGNLVGAGYQVAPDLAAMREGMLGMAGNSLGQTLRAQQYQPAFDSASSRLFGMGMDALPQSMDINAASQKYMQQQQGLMAPGREAALAGIQNKMFQQGRGGLSVGGTVAGNRAATNPEMAAYYNSIAQQDQQLAANAEQQARSNRQADINTGVGLMGAGVNTLTQGYGLQSASMKPWQDMMAGAGMVEGLGQGALDQSSALGAKMSTAGANQAQYLSRATTGGTGYSALGAGLMGLSQNQQFTSGLGNWLNTPSQPSPSPYNVGGYTPAWGTNGAAYNPNIYGY